MPPCGFHAQHLAHVLDIEGLTPIRWIDEALPPATRAPRPRQADASRMHTIHLNTGA